MAEKESDRRRFDRIRDVGESVVGAARTVTGQSAATEIVEFTEAYTEVLTGLHEDFQRLSRRADTFETEQKRALQQANVEVKILRRRVRQLIGISVAAVLAGTLAIALVLAI